MMRIAKLLGTFLATALVLWLPFALACLAAVPVAATALLAWLATAVIGDQADCSQALYRYAKNLLGGMDRVLSGLRGLDARYTLSAHCGVATACDLVLVRRVLDAISAGHCAGVAQREGLAV